MDEVFGEEKPDLTDLFGTAGPELVARSGARCQG